MNQDDPEVLTGKPFNVTVLFKEELASAKMTLNAADAPAPSISQWETKARLVGVSVIRKSLAHLGSNPVTAPLGDIDLLDQMLQDAVRTQIRQHLGRIYIEVALGSDLPVA